MLDLLTEYDMMGRMKTRKCYQCGYCCTVSACGHGEWDAQKKRCKFLTPENKCAKYAQIVRHEKAYPHLAMMGCGCSSPLCNDRREAKMKALGLDPLKEQDDIFREMGEGLGDSPLDFSEDFPKLWDEMMEAK